MLSQRSKRIQAKSPILQENYSFSCYHSTEIVNGRSVQLEATLISRDSQDIKGNKKIQPFTIAVNHMRNAQMWKTGLGRRSDLLRTMLSQQDTHFLFHIHFAQALNSVVSQMFLATQPFNLRIVQKILNSLQTLLMCLFQ